MYLSTLFIVCVAALALLHLGIVPRLERQLSKERGPLRIPKVGLLSLFQFMRTCSVIGLIGAIFLIGIFFWAYSMNRGGASAAQIDQALAGLQGWHQKVMFVRPIVSFAITGVLIAGLAIFAYRNGKRRNAEVFQAIYDGKLQQIKNQMERGELEQLPPNAHMQEIDKLITDLSNILKKAEAEAEVEKVPVPLQLRSEIEGKIEYLTHTHTLIDLHRRVDLEIESETPRSPPPRTIPEKVGNFFISQGLIGSMRGGSRLLFVIGTFLLIPSLLGVLGQPIALSLRDRIVHLEELRLRANEQQAHLEWEAAQRQIGSSPASEDDDKSKDDDKHDEPDDDETISQMARHFEQAHAMQIAPLAVGSLEAVRVRQSILQTLATHAPGANLGVAKSLSHAADAAHLEKLEKAGLKNYERAAETTKPVTSVGEQFANDLRKTAKERPALFQRMKASFKKRVRTFQVPVSEGMLHRTMASQIFGDALSGTNEAGQAAAELSNQLVSDLGRDSLLRNYRISAMRFQTVLARGGTVEAATEAVANHSEDVPRVWADAKLVDGMEPVMRRVPHDAVVSEALRTHPPALLIKPDPGVDMEKAAGIAEEIKALHLRISHEPPPSHLAESLATYEDHFPSQMRAETKTTQGDLLRRWKREAGIVEEASEGRNPVAAQLLERINQGPHGGAGGGGGGGFGGFGGGGGPSHGGAGIRGGGPRPGGFRPSGGGATFGEAPLGSAMRGAVAEARVTSGSLGAFLRGRSFFRLRGFSRIGGVLIGNDPAASTRGTLRFNDLRFEDRGRELLFIFHRADGTQIKLGPYRKTLVRSALGYAADGRPVTVTMVTAAPQSELKILLHPSLVDSALGCRAIDLDRLVDFSTAGSEPNDDQQRRDATTLVEAHKQLYQLAWSIRAMELTPNDKHDELSYETYAQYSSKQSLVTRALANPQLLSDAQRSPLTVKKDYFESRLVGYVVQCAKTARGDQHDFERCIVERTTAERSFYEDDKTWQHRPPDWQIWSGVREQSFHLDPELNFAKPQAAKKDSGLWPFDFMVQVSFTTPPIGTKADDISDAVDDEPWAFPKLKPFVRHSVAALIKHDPKVQSLVEDLREFALLQRLFRVALEGELGPRFPLKRLNELSQIVATDVGHAARTPRWNAIPAKLELEFLSTMIGITRELSESRESSMAALAPLQKCQAFIMSYQPTAALATVAQDVWDENCGPEVFSRSLLGGRDRSRQILLLALLTQRANMMSKARRQRTALDVQRDAQTGDPTERWRCPAP